jgi:hypothetical protein
LHSFLSLKYLRKTGDADGNNEGGNDEENDESGLHCKERF